jgi:hypothetical protein
MEILAADSPSIDGLFAVESNHQPSLEVVDRRAPDCPDRVLEEVIASDCEAERNAAQQTIVVRDKPRIMPLLMESPLHLGILALLQLSPQPSILEFECQNRWISSQRPISPKRRFVNRNEPAVRRDPEGRRWEGGRAGLGHHLAQAPQELRAGEEKAVVRAQLSRVGIQTADDYRDNVAQVIREALQCLEKEGHSRTRKLQNPTNYRKNILRQFPEQKPRVEQPDQNQSTDMPKTICEGITDQ